MAVSEKNQLTGTVSAVAMGAVNDEVELGRGGGVKWGEIFSRGGGGGFGVGKGKKGLV